MGRLAQVRVGIERDEGLHREGVLGGDRRGDLLAHRLEVPERLDARGDLLDGGGVDLLLGGDHHDRRYLVGPRELRGEPGDLRRLRGLGQIGGAVVGGDLADAAEVGAAERHAGEPAEDQQRREQAPQHAVAPPRGPTMGRGGRGGRGGAARHGVPSSVHCAPAVSHTSLAWRCSVRGVDANGPPAARSGVEESP